MAPSREEHFGQLVRDLSPATGAASDDGSFWFVPLYTYFEALRQRNPSWSLIALTRRYLRHATVATTSPAQP